MQIEKITIFGGRNKLGEKEPVRSVTLKMEDVVSIVGPTGSGKTALINDIELFANENTPSKRKVFFNDSIYGEGTGSSQNLIALITQHTNFLSDLPVQKFLITHARIRNFNSDNAVEETLNFANQLTGEPIIPDCAMTELSGGQTRSLLIADAVIIGNSPIILLDEIENAGINRTKAIELLKQYRKIFIFVTHDPRIALFSDFRIVMRNGGMVKVINSNDEEKRVGNEIKKLDDLLLKLRASLRDGENIREQTMNAWLKELGYIS